MAAVDYITLPALRQHVGQQSSEFDDKLQNVITSVSRWIDGACERHFWRDGTSAEPVTREFEVTCSGKLLKLGPYNDLVELQQVDGEAATGYRLRPVNRQGPELKPYTAVEAPSSWEAGSVVALTGVWGWPEIPSLVPQATLIQCARIYRRKDSSEGVVGMDQFGMVRVSGRPDPDVVQMLDDYHHPQAVLYA